MNDSARSLYTYAVMVPYLNMALTELQTVMQENNISYENALSAVLAITAGVVDIGGSTGPALPSDLIVPQQLWERTTGTNNDFDPMEEREFLPKKDVTAIDTLGVWAWQKQIIRLTGCNTNTDVQIDYLAANLATVVDENSTINLFNSEMVLAYRTAGLMASFIGENKSRADDLNSFAAMELDKFVSINTKERQAIHTRRQPFRARWKTNHGIGL